MKLTISERLRFEASYGLRERFELGKERLARFVAWRLLPRHVRYWVVIRAWADATQGQWSHVEAPGVLAEELLKRMR